MVDQIRTRMKADEFLQLPETNLPIQLIEGEVYAQTAHILAHQDTIGNLIVLFQQFERVKGGKAYVAPVDVVLDEDNVPQPDVLWLAPDSRCKPINDGKRLGGPPDLIAEVLSPSTGKLDKRDKFRVYERFGVREYWILEPLNQLIEVWLHNGERFDMIDVYGAGETFTSALVGKVDTKQIFGL